LLALPQARIVAFCRSNVGLQASNGRNRYNRLSVQQRHDPSSVLQDLRDGKGPGGKDMVMLNVRCLDGVDAEQFKVKKFDGASM
jgi:hypothetical protein